MILKLLLVIGVIAVVYFFFIKKKPIEAKKNKSNKKESSKPQSSEMMECVACGTYCEIDDMILSNAKYYCSKECLESSK
ncbi:MAG: PP0621 family protein [Campylobacterota bacterium]|nr:PP0621 family protein [Campylobacterota bacterium]